MQQSNHTKNFKPGTPMFGVAMGLVGVAVALSFLYFGWGALLIIALFALGYVLGTQCLGNVAIERNAAKAGSMRAGLITGIVGILVALSLILFGFWSTLLIALLFVVGYVLGSFGYNALKAEKTTEATEPEETVTRETEE